MSLFDKDSRKHQESTDDGLREAPSGAGSSSDAEVSAAHIAALVRRTAVRLSAPSASAVAHPDGTARRQSELDAGLDPAPGPAQVSKPATSPPRPLAAQRDSRPSGQPGRRLSWPTLAAGCAAVVLVVTGALAVVGPDAPGDRPAPQTSARSAPAGYTVKVTDIITDCASHSRGQTKSSFEKRNCVKATRSMATGQVSGHLALFVVSQIQMGSVEAAASVKQVLDSTGTGNLNDLLREGRTFPGAPKRMPSSGYASVQTGTVIQVAEAGFLDGRSSSSSNPALRAAAAQVASLKTPQY